jgi:hypothetical protein
MKYVVHDMLRSTSLGMFYRQIYVGTYMGVSGGTHSVRKIDEYSVFEYSEKSESNPTCPRSVTEFYGGIVFFPLHQARKYVLTSWYCQSVILSVPRGIIFLVSLAIKAETCDGYYSTAVGTHAP